MLQVTWGGPTLMFDPWAVLGNGVNGQSLVTTIKRAWEQREFRRAKREAAKALIYHAPGEVSTASESWERYLSPSAGTEPSETFDQAHTLEKLTAALRTMNLVSTPVTPQQEEIIQAILQITAETGSPAEQLLIGTVQQANLEQGQRFESLNTNLDEIKALLRESGPRTQRDPHQQELDQVKGLLNAGNLLGGRQFLNDLQAQAVPEIMSAENRAYYWRLQGAVARLDGEVATAVQYYKSAFDLDSTSSSALFTRALAALMEEQPRAALNYLQRIPEQDELRGDAVTLSVTAFVALDDVEALQKLESHLSPDQLELGLALARAAWTHEHFQRADHVLSVITQGRRGNDPRVSLFRAMTFVLRSQTEFKAGASPQEVSEHPDIKSALAWVEEALSRLKGDPRRRDDLQLAYQVKLEVIPITLAAQSSCSGPHGIPSAWSGGVD